MATDVRRLKIKVGKDILDQSLEFVSMNAKVDVTQKGSWVRCPYKRLMKVMKRQMSFHC